MLFCLALGQAEAGVSSLAEMPFQDRPGLICLQFRVPQAGEPLNFLLDSGAGVSVVHLRTARRLGLKLGGRVRVRGVHSSMNGYWPTRLPAQPGQDLLAREYLAVDLRELSEACDGGVDGLIGADFFRGRVVQLDFRARKIRLLNRLERTAEAEVLPLKNRGRALLVPVQIESRGPEWVRLDTGCASALQWVVPKGTRTGERDRTVSIGLSEVSIPTTRTRVKLGAQQFESVPTGLHHEPIFPGEAGLLGIDLLSRFECVTIDAKAGRLVLQGRRADR